MVVHDLQGLARAQRIKLAEDLHMALARLQGAYINHRGLGRKHEIAFLGKRRIKMRERTARSREKTRQAAFQPSRHPAGSGQARGVDHKGRWQTPRTMQPQQMPGPCHTTAARRSAARPATPPPHHQGIGQHFGTTGLQGPPVWPRAVRVIMPMIKPPVVPTAKACTAAEATTQPTWARASRAKPTAIQA